jgi:hypothetical protein
MGHGGVPSRAVHMAYTTPWHAQVCSSCERVTTAHVSHIPFSVTVAEASDGVTCVSVEVTLIPLLPRGGCHMTAVRVGAADANASSAKQTQAILVQDAVLGSRRGAVY